MLTPISLDVLTFHERGSNRHEKKAEGISKEALRLKGKGSGTDLCPVHQRPMG